MTISAKNAVRNNVLVYFVFLLLSLCLFYPVLHKNFASDDFGVLRRVVYGDSFFMKDYFRPLSDITLYFSYLTGGFNPLYYNLFNVLVHAGCCFMLYYFCLLYNGVIVKNRVFFAWFSALLFLIYPFHNETVIWVVGRASLVSCFFGFLSLLTAFSDLHPFKKYSLSCLFYFLGMCSYETILPLPGIILVLLYIKDKSIKSYIPVVTPYTITLIINLVIRYLVSGVIYGNYGAQMFSPSLKLYVIKFLKVSGRLFLPPADFPVLMGICFTVLVLVVLALSIMIFKRRNEVSPSYIKITLALSVSCLVPVMFGLSTKTYEGDRIFYFTSFFLCMWIAYLADIFSRHRFTLCINGLILIYFIFFFYQGLFIWKKAGDITTAILEKVQQVKVKGNNLFLINMPEEYHGAQVLRNNFKDALVINHIDTAGIRVINYLNTASAIKINGNIKAERRQDGVFVYPNAFISTDTIQARVLADVNMPDSVHVKYRNTDQIYYWNKVSFVFLNNPF